MERGPKERILTLDLLRGYFLLVIIIDHLFRFPSLFELFTGRGQLWVSAAEGFFIISGLLVGYIYKTKIVTNPRGVFIKVWKRAGKLYLLSVGLTTLFTLWGWILNSPGVKLGIWPFGESFGLMVFKTVTLQYVYGWADFLPFYAVFMVFAPLCLWLIAKKNALAVLVISGIIWVCRGNNFYLAWQTLFVAGIVVGFYFSRLDNFFISLRRPVKKLLSVTLFGSAVITLMISTFFVFGIWTIFRASWVSLLPEGIVNFLTAAKDFYYPIQTPWFDKVTLPPIRLVLSGLWFTSLLVLFRRQERFLVNLLGGLLLKFGQNSLLVYVVHGFLLFPSFIFLPGNTGFFGNTFIDIAVIGVVYGIVIWRTKVVEGLTRLLFPVFVGLGIVKVGFLEANEGDD